MTQTLLFAQEIESSVLDTLQAYVQKDQFDKAESIITSFRGKKMSERSVYFLNIIHNDIGIKKYMPSFDIQAYIPYKQSGIEAFTFISNHMNKDNVSHFPSMWIYLACWSDIFSKLDNHIIDSLYLFSNRYYKEFGQKDYEMYYFAQNQIFQNYFNKQEWKKCIDIMLQVESNISQNSSATVQIARSRFDIGHAYMKMQDFKLAENWLSSSYSVFSNIGNREDNRIYGCLLLFLSQIYFEHVRNIDKAYKFSLQAERINKKLFGEGTKSHIASLEILMGSELILGKKQACVEHLNQIEVLLNSTQDLNEAEKKDYYDKIRLADLRLNIKREVTFQDTIVTENTLLFEATNAYVQGNIKEAINLFRRLLEKYESNFQVKNVSNYIYVVGSLSNALISVGNYIQADSLLDKAITMIRSNRVDSIFIRGLYESKGNLYFSINNADMALYWYNQAKAMYGSNEESSLQYGSLISYLAMCQMTKKDYQLAKQLSDKAYGIIIQFYGDDSTNANERLSLLNTLATIYVKLKDFSKGKELYKRIIDEAISPQNIGAKALALVNLSDIYLLYENNFSKAEECLLEIKHMNAPSYVQDIAEMYLLFAQVMQKKDNTVDDIEKYNTRITKEVAKMYGHFSEIEREAYWTQKSQFMVLLDNLSALIFNSPKSIGIAYNNAIFTKNMLIKSNRLLGQLVKDCDSDIQGEYSSMINMKRKLSDKNCPYDSLDVYREVISQREKAIVASIPNFDSKLMTQFKTFGDVQRMLSDNDIAIEFIFLPQIKKPIEESELSYGAMLLTKGDTIPKLIPLCSEFELKNLMDSYTPMRQYEIDSLYAFSNNILYKMIWEKLEPYIPVGSTIYYSPTGYISKINLSAISNGNNRLAEAYNFYEVSSTAMIDEVKEGVRIEYHNAVLYGDINYYEDVDLMAEKAREFTLYAPGEILATRSLNRGTWDLLPGTKEEVETISELFRDKGLNTYMLTQNDANEESFKSLDSNAPTLIHIATHGFYFPPEKDIPYSFFNGLHSYTQKDYSMLYGGLMFAGGNNTWTGKAIGKNVEDGILTADEISRLDLSNNKLIVLSACDTGLGAINKVDGVFGLQRGLKRAGVKTILMSLWKVPDKETKELMARFYGELLAGNSPHHSLKLAQEQLKNDGKSPYYWAGFILLD